MDGFAHTHLRNFKTAKYLVELSIYKRLPLDLSNYLLISLQRINDGEYKAKIEELRVNKRRKTQYYNVNKGVKK